MNQENDAKTKGQRFASLNELLARSPSLFGEPDYFVYDPRGIRALSPEEMEARMNRDLIGMPNFRHEDTEWRILPNRDWCGLTPTRWESIHQSVSKFFHWLFRL